MSKRIKRQKYKIANKYQKLIIMPVLVTNVILLLIAAVFFLYFTLNSYAVSLERPPILSLFQSRIFGILIFSAIVYCSVVLVAWGFKISSRFAGPIGRIDRELGEIESGKKTDKKIVLRKGDFLAEIIDKLNKIFEKLP